MVEVELAWVDISRRKRAERDAKIPPQWRVAIPDEDNLTDLPRRTSIFSERELEITENYDSTNLLQEIRSGGFSSVEVTQAFCKVSVSATSRLAALQIRNTCGKASGIADHHHQLLLHG